MIEAILNEYDLKIGDKFELVDDDGRIRYPELTPFSFNEDGYLICSNGIQCHFYERIRVLGNIVSRVWRIDKIIEPTPFMKMLGLEYNQRFNLVLKDSNETKFSETKHFYYYFNKNGYLTKEDDVWEDSVDLLQEVISGKLKVIKDEE